MRTKKSNSEISKPEDPKKRYQPIPLPDDKLLLQCPRGPSFLLPTMDVWLIDEMLKENHERLMVSDFIVNTIQPHETYVEVGAGFGYHGVQLAAHQPRRSGHVFLCEPVGIARKYLHQNLDLNAEILGNVSVIEYPLGAETATVDIFEARRSILHGSRIWINAPDRLREGGFKRVSTQIVPLDTILGDCDDIGLLKVDVNGGELDVIRGCARIIERNPQITLLVRWDPQILDFSELGRDGLWKFLRRRFGKVEVLGHQDQKSGFNLQDCEDAVHLVIGK